MKSTKTQAFAMPPMPTLASSQKLFSAGIQLQAQAMKAVLGYQIETLGFLKRRLEQDLAMTDELARSTEFNDALEVVSTYVQKAAADYTAEAGKMSSMGSRLASETAKRARDEAEGVIEDMVAQTVA